MGDTEEDENVSLFDGAGPGLVDLSSDDEPLFACSPSRAAQAAEGVPPSPETQNRPPPRGCLYATFAAPGKLGIRFQEMRDEDTPAGVDADLAYVQEILPAGLAAGEPIIVPGLVLAVINGEIAREMEFSSQMSRLIRRPLTLGFCAPKGNIHPPAPKKLGAVGACIEALTASVDKDSKATLINWRKTIVAQQEKLIAGSQLSAAEASQILEKTRNIMAQLKQRLSANPSVQGAVLTADACRDQDFLNSDQAVDSRQQDLPLSIDQQARVRGVVAAWVEAQVLEHEATGTVLWHCCCLSARSIWPDPTDLDASLRQHRMQPQDAPIFDVRKELIASDGWSDVVDELDKMDSGGLLSSVSSAVDLTESPLPPAEMLSAVLASVGKIYDAPHVIERNELCADDLLPILSYALAHCSVGGALGVCAEWIQQLCAEWLDGGGQPSYYYTVFCSALRYLAMYDESVKNGSRHSSQLLGQESSPNVGRAPGAAGTPRHERVRRGPVECGLLLAQFATTSSPSPRRVPNALDATPTIAVEEGVPPSKENPMLGNKHTSASSEDKANSNVVIGWCRVAGSLGIDVHQSYNENSPVVARLAKDDRCALVRIGPDNCAWRQKDSPAQWSPAHWSDCDGLSILPQGGQLAVLCDKGWVRSVTN